MTKNGKKIICVFACIFVMVSVLAVPVLAVDAEIASGYDTFICAVPCDGTFYVNCKDVDPSYERGATYDWLIDTAVFSFRETAQCQLLYFSATHTGAITSQDVTFVDLNNGGSDPAVAAKIYITKAKVVENSAGSPYDRLYLNFAVMSSDGATVWSSTSIQSPAFVNCFDARGMVYLPTNSIVLKIAQYMPESSPNIFNVVRESTYSNGYNAGVADGQKEGYEIARKELYQPTFDKGYLNGYNDAAKQLDKFNFRTFIEAVIFAPIDAFLEIFNFDFLGFNMRAFVASVLTLVIVMSVVLIILKFKSN